MASTTIRGSFGGDGRLLFGTFFALLVVSAVFVWEPLGRRGALANQTSDVLGELLPQLPVKTLHTSPSIVATQKGSSPELLPPPPSLLPSPCATPSTPGSLSSSTSPSSTSPPTRSPLVTLSPRPPMLPSPTGTARSPIRRLESIGFDELRALLLDAQDEDSAGEQSHSNFSVGDNSITASDDRAIAPTSYSIASASTTAGHPALMASRNAHQWGADVLAFLNEYSDMHARVMASIALSESSTTASPPAPALPISDPQSQRTPAAANASGSSSNTTTSMLPAGTVTFRCRTGFGGLGDTLRGTLTVLLATLSSPAPRAFVFDCEQHGIAVTTMWRPRLSGTATSSALDTPAAATGSGSGERRVNTAPLGIDWRQPRAWNSWFPEHPFPAVHMPCWTSLGSQRSCTVFADDVRGLVSSAGAGGLNGSSGLRGGHVIATATVSGLDALCGDLSTAVHTSIAASTHTRVFTNANLCASSAAARAIAADTAAAAAALGLFTPAPQSSSSPSSLEHAHNNWYTATTGRPFPPELLRMAADPASHPLQVYALLNWLFAPTPALVDTILSVAAGKSPGVAAALGRIRTLEATAAAAAASAPGATAAVPALADTTPSHSGTAASTVPALGASVSSTALALSSGAISNSSSSNSSGSANASSSSSSIELAEAWGSLRSLLRYTPGRQVVIAIHLRIGSQPAGSSFEDPARADMERVVPQAARCARVAVEALAHDDDAPDVQHGHRPVLWYIACDRLDACAALRALGVASNVSVLSLDPTSVMHTDKGGGAVGGGSAAPSDALLETFAGTYAEHFLLSAAHAMVATRSGFSGSAARWGGVSVFYELRNDADECSAAVGGIVGSGSARRRRRRQ